MTAVKQADERNHVALFVHSKLDKERIGTDEESRTLWIIECGKPFR